MAKRTKKEDFSLTPNKDRDRFYSKLDKDQLALFDSIQNNIFTFCEATAGSGKTTVSVLAMLGLLEKGEINKIVYIQKPTQRSLSQGYLPGTLEEKAQFIFLPFYDAMHELGFFDSVIEQGKDQDVISLVTDCALRGVNLEKAGVILDESQNLDLHTMKLIFTRCHDNCHIVMLGDREQKDNKGNNTKFVEYGDYLASSKIGNKCTLTKNYRGKFSQLAENFRED